MKIILITLLFFVNILNSFAQTTYTYTDAGSSEWTDIANWDNYPGTSIAAGNTVIISTGHSVNITNGVILTNSGLLDILSDGSLTNNGSLIITSSGHLINRGLTTNAGILTNAGALENYEEMTITNDGSLTNDESLYSPGAITIMSDGTLNNNRFLSIEIFATLSISGTLINTFSLEIYGETTITNDGTLTNGGGIGIGGEFDGGDLNNAGTLINNGTLSLSSLGTLTNSGTLAGTNLSHYGDYSNNGILSPGNSAGTYLFNDNYIHNSSTLDIELENATTFDKVTVTTEAILSGTLNVSLLNGFTPSVGDTFKILTAAEVSGTFDTTNLPPDYNWLVNYTATEVSLEVTSILSTSNFELNSFKLYPNPSRNQFTIILDNSLSLQKVNIYNSIGQLVLDSETTHISTSKLSSGPYIVEVVTNNGKATKKLVIY